MITDLFYNQNHFFVNFYDNYENYDFRNNFMFMSNVTYLWC